jgi:NitT/TauT family transport system ATP-binding protein
MEPFIQVDHATMAYAQGREFVKAVDDVSFSVPRGEFLVIVGPSGCGKTTLLHAIGGLAQLTDGDIRIGGRVTTGPGADRVMMFQEYSLFRWRTVRRNVDFALECRGFPKSERPEMVDRLLKQTGLERSADMYPDRLSGGMKQRVALARALAANAEILLMDEPFGALDAQTRLIMQELLLEVWEGSKKTVLFVTHDLDEAIHLADRILIMSGRPGRIKAERRVIAPRPRPADFLLSDRFISLKRDIMASIKAEDFRYAAE